MSTTAPISGLQPDPTPSPPAPSSSSSGSGNSPSLPIDDQPDLRLVIEDDKAAGSYVYKTINPVTGQVVSQIPREELLRMREAPDYTPGSIIAARG
jgi:flagellar protein FlaG